MGVRAVPANGVDWTPVALATGAVTVTLGLLSAVTIGSDSPVNVPPDALIVTLEPITWFTVYVTDTDGVEADRVTELGDTVPGAPVTALTDRETAIPCGN